VQTAFSSFWISSYFTPGHAEHNLHHIIHPTGQHREYFQHIHNPQTQCNSCQGKIGSLFLAAWVICLVSRLRARVEKNQDGYQEKDHQVFHLYSPSAFTLFSAEATANIRQYRREAGEKEKAALIGACLQTPRGADFSEFSFQARHFCEGVPEGTSSKSNEAWGEKALKDAL
jgi:hypothetical protein